MFIGWIRCEFDLRQEVHVFLAGPRHRLEIDMAHLTVGRHVSRQSL